MEISQSSMKGLKNIRVYQKGKQCHIIVALPCKGVIYCSNEKLLLSLSVTELKLCTNRKEHFTPIKDRIRNQIKIPLRTLIFNKIKFLILPKHNFY